MIGILLLAVALLLGGVIIGRLSMRRATSAKIPPGGPVPSPSSWVLRANRAAALWLMDSEGKVLEQVADPDEPIPQLDSLTRRVAGILPADPWMVERLEEGRLVIAGGARVRGAMLLRHHSREETATAARDLVALIQRREHEPVMAEIGRQQERPGESLESMCTRLAHHLERIFDAEVIVALHRPAGLEVMGVSFRTDRRPLHTLVPEESALGRVARATGTEPVVDINPLGEVTGERREAGRALVLAIRDQGNTLGAVAVRVPGTAVPSGPRWAELVTAIRNAAPRLRAGIDAREKAELATHDPLTGLRNRRGLEEIMRKHDHREGALVYLDLDRFKSLNDTLGHPAGDAALVLVARLVQAQIREGDIAARIGGEEIALWLPGADVEEGRVIAERVRGALESSEWKWQGRSWPITASLGVAVCPGTTVSPDNLAAQADRALYQAKTGGRNRVVVSGKW